MWNLFNSQINDGESVRIFPLSNWTELDVWQYLKVEKIPIVPLYYSRKRKVIERNGILIPVYSYDIIDPDNKNPITDKEIEDVYCRFRSLGCIPCTGAVRSNAIVIDDIIDEVIEAKKSERENRIIDLTSDSSMEQKKREGYF